MALEQQSRAALSETIVAAGIPLESLSGLPPAMVVTYASGATTQQISDGDAIIAAWDWSDAAQLARDNLVKRAIAKALFLTTDGEGKSKRAIASILLDENNALRQWIMAFKAASAAATSLIDFKARVAALDNMPDRTMAQAKAAYSNRVDDGTVDD